MALLNSVENALSSLKSLTLINEAAEILAILFTDIGEEGTNRDFMLVEELACRCSQLEKLPIKHYSESNLNDLLTAIAYKYRETNARNLGAFLMHYFKNDIICKAPIERFDLSLMAGVGGVLNAFKQSCISMFNTKKFKVRGFSIGGGVGLGGGLFFGTPFSNNAYELIKHYDDTKGMQFKENITAFMYDIFILFKGIKNRPGREMPQTGWSLVGAGSFLVSGVAKELEISWIKEKSRSDKESKQKKHMEIFEKFHSITTTPAGPTP